MTDKKSLQQPATKRDIVNLGGKISRTKQGLRKEISQTKQELKGKISQTKQELRKEIFQTKQELKEEIRAGDAGLHKEIKDLRGDLTGQIDGLAKLIKDQNQEFQIHKMTHQREQKQLNDHEERIDRLEEVTP